MQTELYKEMAQSILDGDDEEAVVLAERAVEVGIDPLDAINQGFIAMKCDKTLPPTYVLQWAESAMTEIKQRASGTTFAEISKKNFRTIPLVVPEAGIARAFSTVANGLYASIAERLRESETLAATRNTLLPCLLSGELRVSEAV